MQVERRRLRVREGRVDLGPGLLRPRNCCSNVSWTVARRWARTRCARTRAEWKTFGIWKSWDYVKRRICAKSNKIILKAGVGLMSTVPQNGQDDRHVNDDPSSLRKSIWDQKQWTSVIFIEKLPLVMLIFKSSHSNPVDLYMQTKELAQSGPGILDVATRTTSFLETKVVKIIFSYNL